MSLTREQRDELVDLIMQDRARTIDLDQATIREAAAKKALSEYIESLVPIAVPEREFYTCVRCQTYIAVKGYCERCAANNAKVDQHLSNAKTGIRSEDADRAKLREHWTS